MRTPHAADEVRERLRALEAGELHPVEPRPAATVVLLRDAPGGPEVYLLLRQRSMAFAAGLHVFPGGSLDPSDAEPVRPWFGPDPDGWAERLGCDADRAVAVVVAAARETFEESGVLLAGPDAGAVVRDVDDATWEARREALLAHETSLAGVLAEAGLGLRTDLLGAWARWITPEVEPRRYDTWFLVAAVPEGQRTRDVSTESEQVRWVPLRQAAEDESIAMMPPTRRTCLELADADDVAGALATAATRRVRPVRPRLVVDGDAVRAVHDDGTQAP